MATTDTLRELGFEAAAKHVEDSKDLVRKTAIAYEHFDYVTPEMVKTFTDALEKKSRNGLNYQTLAFIPVATYTEVPPVDVLEKLAAAKKWNCFDEFVIAKIEARVEVKDPILFGKVKDCGDYFYICNWDYDVTLEAIKECNVSNIKVSK